MTTIRWECTNPFCLDGSRWWLSVYGALLCLNCRPPTFPNRIARQGHVTDAPLVDPLRTFQPYNANVRDTAPVEVEVAKPKKASRKSR